MRTISSGIFIMALDSQLSKLLAKFRMAWVKAPTGDRKTQQMITYSLSLTLFPFRLFHQWQIQAAVKGKYLAAVLLDLRLVHCYK